MEAPAKRKRGRPKTSDKPLIEPPPIVEVVDEPEIKVLNPSFLLEQLDDIQRKESEREWKRQAAANEIAQYRWQIAKDVHRLEDGVSKLNFRTHPYQVDIYKDVSLDLVVMGSTQWGKAIRKGTRILTASGASVPIETLNVGHMVMAPDGTPTRVVGVYPQGRLPLYKFAFADERTIEVCGEHLWAVSPIQGGPTTVLNTLTLKHIIQQFPLYVPVPKISGAEKIDPRIISINESVEDEAICIAVDHPDKLFVAQNFIVTHNTELLIVDMVASAICGLKVIVVISKHEKRSKFVASRLDPCFQGVPVYKAFMEQAAGRGAQADSTQLKHMGDGSINLLSANSPKDFTSYAADKAIVDEYQECKLENVEKVDQRMTGSWFRGKIRVGHPTTAGTEMNGNLDFLYQNSDRRLWLIPCPTCKKYQNLTWWNHVVHEERGTGGILSVRPRDPEWKKGQKFDIRPICEECHRPMDRLHEEGIWEPQSPGIMRHGYKLSNIYNANVRLDEALANYSAARHSAHKMQEFHNKFLGEPYDMDGSKINESMLTACAGGEGTGILPYRFVPARNFQWRKELIGA